MSLSHFTHLNGNWHFFLALVIHPLYSQIPSWRIIGELFGCIMLQGVFFRLAEFLVNETHPCDGNDMSNGGSVKASASSRLFMYLKDRT